MKPEDFIKIAKKIAWKVHKRIPSVEYEELVGEAVMRTYECYPKWDRDKGEFSTFAYQCVTNKLYDFCRGDIRYRHLEGLPDRSFMPDLDVFLNDVQKLRLAGYSNTEIASALNLNVKEVRRRVRINISKA